MTMRSGQSNTRSTLPEFLNSGNSLHFAQSRVKLFSVFVLILAVTAAMCALGYDWIPNPLSERLHEKLRFMGPFFGLVSLPFAFYFLINAGRKGVVLTRVGVTDYRTSSQIIPWHRIEDVSERGFGSSRFVVLRLSHPSDAPRSLLQALNSMVLRLDDNERTISSAGLRVSHQRLVEAIAAGWHTSLHPQPAPSAGRATAMPREFGRR